jgi:hypothetical protein
MFNNRLFKFSQEVVDNSPSDKKLDIENNSNNEQIENSDKRVVEQIHDISKGLSYFSLDFLLALNKNFERAFFDYIRKTAIDPEIREKVNSIYGTGTSNRLFRLIHFQIGLDNVLLYGNKPANEVARNLMQLLSLFRGFRTIYAGWDAYKKYYVENELSLPQDFTAPSYVEELKHLIKEYMFANSGENRFYINKIIAYRQYDYFFKLPFVQDFIKKRGIVDNREILKYLVSVADELWIENKRSGEELSNRAINVIIDYLHTDESKYDEIINALRGPRLFDSLLGKEEYSVLADNLRRNWVWNSKKISEYLSNIRNTVISNIQGEVSKSKHFDEFNLSNASNAEREIFQDLEKLGLNAIPAKQAGNISLVDDEGQKFGFRIDFLLPCNVREYDGETFTLRSDIVFVGEYFGYYGSDYDRKKIRKIQWQNNLENSLDQRCLHIEPGSNLCNVLKEKNIDSKCYPDFGGHLFNVEDINQKKTFYVKSQLQNFLYTYLVNELLWQINYNYNFNTMENFNKVKEKNQSYIDRYQKLLDNIREYKAKELVAECMKILEDYKKPFNREKKLGDRSLRLSKTFNNRNNPSIL